MIWEQRLHHDDADPDQPPVDQVILAEPLLSQLGILREALREPFGFLREPFGFLLRGFPERCVVRWVLVHGHCPARLAPAPGGLAGGQTSSPPITLTLDHIAR